MSTVDNDSSDRRGAQTDAEVLFAVLHAEGPTTTKEVADHLGLSTSTAHRAFRRLYNDGLLLRRERDPDLNNQCPHEYVVAPVDGHKPHVGPVACSECGRQSNVLAPGVECTYRYCEGVFEPA